MLPIAARKAFGENASVLPVPRRTAAAPIASAVRIIVPRLPGSCNASSAAISPCGKSSALSGAVKSGVLTAAAIPCGAEVSHTVSSTARLTEKNSAPSAETRASKSVRPCSINNVSGTMPASSASKTSRSPSIRCCPLSRRAERSRRRRTDFTISFFVLVISIFGCPAAKELIRRPPAVLHAQADRRRMYS